MLFQFKYHRLITLYANEKLNFIAIIDFILIIFSPIFAFHEQRKLNKMRKRIDLIKIKFAITLKRYMFYFPAHTHTNIFINLIKILIRSSPNTPQTRVLVYKFLFFYYKYIRQVLCENFISCRAQSINKYCTHFKKCIKIKNACMSLFSIRN